ncbi:hypothetical protein V6C27_01145 [Peptococcaceae bacterium 1198_IL3148]
MAIVVCIVVIFYSTSVMLEKRYQSAVELINDQKWYQAEHALKIVHNYKDSEVLKRYVWANIKLDLIDHVDLKKQHYAPVLEYLNEIPGDYQGLFKTEISEFRNYILQKSGSSNKSTEPLKSLRTGDRYLYFEEEYITPMFFGL